MTHCVKQPRYGFSAKIIMIFRLSTQKIVEKDRDRYQQQKKCLLVPPLSEAELTIMCTKCCCKRLCFLGFCHFSKKIWVLAARLGARNFTRALGYAKHPLSVAHAFADARFCRRTLSQTHAFADARFQRHKLSQTQAFADASFCICTLPLSFV